MVPESKSRASRRRPKPGKLGVLVASLIALSCDVHAQTGTWTKKADLPMPRVGATAAVVNGRIYVTGSGACGVGCHTDLTAHLMYDPLRDSWETRAPLPTPRGFPLGAVVNEDVYVMGGGYPTLDKTHASDTVEVYDPVTDTWSPRASLLAPRLGGQAAVLDGIIYILGGNYSERNCEAYDPGTNTWTSKAFRPECGGVLAATVHDGVIYTFGGCASLVAPSSSVYAYDPRSNTWAKKSSMPTKRYGLQTFLVDGKIFALGGSKGQYSGLTTVEAYDPVTDTWESKPDMPESLTFFGGGVVNNKIYIIGGSSDWRSTKSTVWEYDPLLTSASAPSPLPEVFLLEQNYPNPFNPVTRVKFQVPVLSNVDLAVYDLLGREVAVLVKRKIGPGGHEVEFDGSGLASGAYVYRMQVHPLDFPLSAVPQAAAVGERGSAVGRASRCGAGDLVQVRKMVLLR